MCLALCWVLLLQGGSARGLASKSKNHVALGWGAGQAETQLPLLWPSPEPKLWFAGPNMYLRPTFQKCYFLPINTSI